MMLPIGTFMCRRDFMTLAVGVSAVAWPLAADAQ
jgi:hypothetical protein